MSQFDMFADAPPIVPAARKITAAPTYPQAVEIELAPLVLRAPPELDAWTRETQRIHLIAHARDLTRLRAAGDSHRVRCVIQNAPYVLLKLNGLGGQW